MNQLDEATRFEPVTKYQKHSPTSVAAAHAIESRAGSIRGRVYQWLMDEGQNGATDLEMQETLDIQADTQRPRRRELQERGLVIDSGKTRKTRSGREAVVWLAKMAGEQLELVL